ncbi:MAG: DM13 domain-containing protein [Phormidesmis sp. CAN_BIN44]|nr:DM13 domain-containing protein [Phormidesmis sp. CAN_BIN44]
MKLNQLIPFGVISTIAIALPLSTQSAQAFSPITSGGTHSRQLQTSRQPGTISAERNFTETALSGEAIAAAGTFVAAEKPTVGTARIVVENGQRYLVFDSAFQTSDQGPDLHVVLDPSNKPPAQYQDPTQYINLGKLQKFAGEQRYPIPATVDLSKFKSVGIWCRMANATFGYAPLQASSNAAR